ncbi:TPA: hypothetical protein ACH3X3_001091 [Trebouxia sp. C0006]
MSATASNFRLTVCLGVWCSLVANSGCMGVSPGSGMTILLHVHDEAERVFSLVGACQLQRCTSKPVQVSPKVNCCNGRAQVKRGI